MQTLIPKPLLPASFILCMMLLVCGLVGSGVPTSWASAVGLVLYGIYVYLVAQRTPYSFALMLDMLFFRGTTLIAGVAIAAGAYMPEVGTQAVTNGVFAYLAVVYIIFSTTFATVAEPLMRKLHKAFENRPPALFEKKLWVKGFIALAVLLILYALALGATKGFPLFTRMDRFSFRQQFEGDRIFFAFIGNRAFLASILGLIFAEGKGLIKRAALGVLLFMLFASFLLGDKFTGIAYMLIAFGVPWMLFNAHTNPWSNIKKFLPIIGLGALITVLTIPAILYMYGWSEGRTEAIDTMLTRVGGQGQLWYVTATDNPEAFRLNTEVLAKDAELLVSAENDDAQQPPYAGIYRLMAIYMPTKLFASYLTRGGVTLTLGFESYLLYLFGWLGMLPVLIFFAVVYVFYQVYYAYSLYTRDPVRLLFALKLLGWAVFGFQQGDFWYILSLPTLAVMVLAIGYEIFQQKRTPFQKTKG